MDRQGRTRCGVDGIEPEEQEAVGPRQPRKKGPCRDAGAGSGSQVLLLGLSALFTGDQLSAAQSLLTHIKQCCSGRQPGALDSLGQGSPSVRTWF